MTAVLTSIRRPRLRIVIGGLFLLFQIAMIVRARFDDDRYFCWAPHDSQNEYELILSLDGRQLRPEEVFDRYRIPMTGVDPRAIEHIKDIVRAGERRSAVAASVTLHYRTNGSERRSWSWPQP